MRTKVVVGIPAFNEERAIAAVVAGALPYGDQVVVVDDGSSDRTSAEALRAGAVVIRHRINCGKGVAVATLFQYAMDARADVLVLLDGDGQHDPQQIPLVAQPCLDNAADVVVGSRFHPESTENTPRFRRIGQLAFNGMTAFASGVRCSDSQSGFRAFNRRAFCAMHLSEASFSVESEMQFECRARQLRLAEVPISCRYEAPPKRNVLAHGFLVLKRLTSMALRRRVLGHGRQPLPVAPRMVLVGESTGELSRFDPLSATMGD